MAESFALLRAPFYFLRHGETEPNHLGLVSGQTDVELNMTGWQQARAAAEQLKGQGITAIYSSPLRRARDTADCIVPVLQLEVVVVPGLEERNWGELEGKPRASRVRGATPAGGESPEEFARRTWDALAGIPGGAVPLIVAHSGTFRVLCDKLQIAHGQFAIENARPVRLVPPAAGSEWTIERI